MKRITVGLVVLFGLSCGLVSPAADFDGDSRDDIAIFRPSAGMWAVRDITRVYFGGSADTPMAADYNGDGIADMAIFRPTAGMWAVRDITRIYFGGSSDTAISGGGGQRLYDYVVKPSDGADLVAALEGTTNSVYIPAGTYNVNEVINVPLNIKRIVGESNSVVIQFSGDGLYLSISGPNTHVSGIRVDGGGDTSSNRGNIYLNGDYITLENCRSVDSLDAGINYSSYAEYVSLVNCVVRNATIGFKGTDSIKTSRLTNCSAYACSTYGFYACHNLSSCVADGNGTGAYGFLGCDCLAACRVVNVTSFAFSACNYISSCMVDGEGNALRGFNSCSNLSSCHVEDLAGGGTEYYSCSLRDTGSCD